ncbi:prolactin receptor-like [Discoglossus pictus]
MGLIDHPQDIKAMHLDHSKELRITWNPPENEFKEFFIYQVEYWPESIPKEHNKIVETKTCSLKLGDLQDGQKYHIRVRTKPSGVDSVDGFWGPWSDSMTVLTPFPAGILASNKWWNWVDVDECR